MKLKRTATVLIAMMALLAFALVSTTPTIAASKKKSKTEEAGEKIKKKPRKRLKRKQMPSRKMQRKPRKRQNPKPKKQPRPCPKEKSTLTKPARKT